MKAFVTGGSGFIGRHVVQKLVARGDTVHALARSEESAASLRQLGATVFMGDITDSASLRPAMEGCDMVFHIAAWYKLGSPDWMRAEAINVGGTRRVLRLAHELGIPKIVVDTDPNHYYKADDPVRVNNEKIADLFGGSTQLSVLVQGDIKDPGILNQMLSLGEYIKSHSQVSQVISIADLISRMNEAFHNGDSTYRVIPENRNLIAQYLLLYSFKIGRASCRERV